LDAVSRMILNPVLSNDDSKTNVNMVLSDKNPGFPYQKVNGVFYINSIVKVDSKASISNLIDMGCKVGAIVNDIATITVPAEKLNEILSQDWLLQMETSRICHKTLDVSRKEINADKVNAGTGLSMPYNGEGVIVADVDSGIDFTHPDFSDSKGTRILYLWDMADTSTTNQPVGYNWGREYNKAFIDQHKNLVMERDSNLSGGHGTHVTGIIAGNGTANPKFQGIAPKANIIFVKASRTMDSQDEFSESDVIAGCQYVFNKADSLKMPAVINLSLGVLLGPHDGTGLFSEALSNLTGPGKIICAAAGNNGNLPIHAGGTLNEGESSETVISPIDVCAYYPDICPKIHNFKMTAADIWYTNGSVDTIGICIYKLNANFTISFLKEFDYPVGTAVTDVTLKANDSTIAGMLNLDASSIAIPPNNDGEIGIQIHNNGDTNIRFLDYFWSFRTIGSKKGKLDLWAGVPVPETYPIAGTQGKQQFKGNNQMTIGAPADGKNIISVGSYVTKVSWTDIDSNSQTDQNGGKMGAMSLFTSLGPTRDGRYCPVISAPGEVIFSAKSSHLTENIGYSRSNVISGGKYMGMSGTSMATPHVTGVVALMLQAKPNLTYDKIVSVLETTARTDAFTGATPNYTAGYGKIDAYAIMKNIVSDVREQPYPIPAFFDVAPIPASGLIKINYTLLESGMVSFTITNSLGIESERINYEQFQEPGNYSLNYDAGNLAPGVYFLTIKAGNKIETKKFVIVR
ncbi:MAG: S8 family serine peptidase, partial [FCB group bacterium]